MITLQARSFLYHQVRLIVAWLVQVGAGKRFASETEHVLAQRSPDAIGAKLAPANGLYLTDVAYDEADLVDLSGNRELGSKAEPHG